MNKLALLVPAAAVLLAGCGGQPQTERSSASPVAQKQAATLSQPSEGGTLALAQDGAALPRTLWYTRVEAADGKAVVESRYPDRPIALTRQLPGGRYRVLAWSRTCTGTCPSSGEDGLGPLEKVCGAAVTVTAGGQTLATFVLSPAGTCAVRTGA
ncbi:hypothetical protein GCM10009665_06960 [Kitasatospora nipponensis]|uniref:Lipoprotein n=1 Tax=Kitasatospora nipponensis TaxID=258049 RepID=A0ABP4GEV4_9ACTN